MTCFNSCKGRYWQSWDYDVIWRLALHWQHQWNTDDADYYGFSLICVDLIGRKILVKINWRETLPFVLVFAKDNANAGLVTCGFNLVNQYYMVSPRNTQQVKVESSRLLDWGFDFKCNNLLHWSSIKWCFVQSNKLLDWSICIELVEFRFVKKVGTGKPFMSGNLARKSFASCST